LWDSRTDVERILKRNGKKVRKYSILIEEKNLKIKTIIKKFYLLMHFTWYCFAL